MGEFGMLLNANLNRNPNMNYPSDTVSAAPLNREWYVVLWTLEAEKRQNSTWAVEGPSVCCRLLLENTFRVRDVTHS